MSVVMILRTAADPAKLEEYAQANEDQLKRITDDAKSRGAIHHAFFAAGDNQVVVIDEWETAEAFQEFFSSNEDVPQVMQALGAGEPQIEFLRQLDTRDEF
jgi:heme-degrading monooxygenase HmoA